jgi:protein O-GlcNAc transferase
LTVPEAFGLACRYHEAGQLGAAEQVCRQIVAAEPRHADAWHLLGVIAYQVGRYELAVEEIGRAIALDGAQSALHSNLGNALQAQGKLDEAIDSYRRAVQLAPEFADAYNNLGAALQAQGKLDEAVDCLRRALALTPGDAECLTNKSG